jgi:hypothetical protein
MIHCPTSDYPQSSVWSRLTLPEVAWCLDVPPATVAWWLRSGRVTASSRAGARSLRFSLDQVLDELNRPGEARTGRRHPR